VCAVRQEALQLESKRAVLSKSDRLVQLLEQELGEGKFSAGQRFLSTHEIARSYSVSPGTARRALGELVGRGYLESSQRSGHFLRGDAPIASGQDRHPVASPAKPATAVMLIVGSAGNWGGRLLEQYAAAVEQACQRIGWQLLRVNNTAREIEQARQGVKVAGCLAYGVHERPAASVDLASVILWGGSWRDRACSMLTANGEEASRQAFEHLWDLGHQHTAMVRALPEGPPERNPKGGLLGMRKAFAALGHSWSMDDVLTVAPDEIDGLYGRIRHRGVTAIVSQDWEITVELYRQAHQCGERIGDRLSIVAAGGHDLAVMVHPKPARIYWRFEDYGAAVVDAMENLSQGRRLPHHLVLPVFLEAGPGAKSVRVGAMK
jgi:DNA-binding LacI/PurR family transcriptional regulator